MKFSELAIGDKFISDGLKYMKTYTADRFNNAVCNQTLDGTRRVPCRVPEDCEVEKVEE